MDNLIAALQQMGVNEKPVLDGVKKDVDAKKFHLACNRVFEFTRRKELKEQGHKDGTLGETITHPNEYFEKSWKLVNGEGLGGAVEVKKEDRMED